MSGADQEALSQFLSVTNAPAEAAQFYLESAGGDVEAAVSAYFESGGAAGAASSMEHQDRADAPTGGDDSDFMPEDAPAVAPAQPPAENSGAGPSRPRRSGRAPAQGGVRGLADLGGRDSGSEYSDDPDDPQGNELYTGGAKSGQVVRAPKKDKANDVAGLFDRAREAGAVDGTEADLRPRDGGGAFSGQARTLAGGDAPALPVEPAAEPSQPPSAAAAVTHTITFFADGVFTVDDGEPRNMRDPENQPFMGSIARGECPQELDPGTRDQPVNVNLVRSHKPYEAPPKPAYIAFSGAGRTLADSGSGPSLAASAPPAPPPPSAASPAVAGGTSAAWPGPDESQPTTSIQLRLADGSRLVARFNLSQTVGDIRGFIQASRPDVAPGYRLATAFPAAELPDDAATIAAAGLQNAVVVQKPAVGGD